MLGRASNRKKKPCLNLFMMVFQNDGYSDTGVVDEGVALGRDSYRLVRSSISKIPHNIRIGSWNIGTLKGRSNEVIEAISRRSIDIYCV